MVVLMELPAWRKWVWKAFHLKFNAYLFHVFCLQTFQLLHLPSFSLRSFLTAFCWADQTTVYNYWRVYYRVAFVAKHVADNAFLAGFLSNGIMCLKRLVPKPGTGIWRCGQGVRCWSMGTLCGRTHQERVRATLPRTSKCPTINIGLTGNTRTKPFGKAKESVVGSRAVASPQNKEWLGACQAPLRDKTGNGRVLMGRQRCRSLNI